MIRLASWASEPSSQALLRASARRRLVVLTGLGAEVTAVDVKDTSVDVARRLRVDFRDKAAIDDVAAPIGRIATPEEQAWPLIVLNSPRLSYVTGTALCVDGGLHGALETGRLHL